MSEGHRGLTEAVTASWISGSGTFTGVRIESDTFCTLDSMGYGVQLLSAQAMRSISGETLVEKPGAGAEHQRCLEVDNSNTRLLSNP